MTFADPDHSAEEEREITVGLSVRQRVILVSHCQRGERTRIISARNAPKKERPNMKKASIKKKPDGLDRSTT